MLTCVYQGHNPELADVRGKEGIWELAADSEDIRIQFNDLSLDKKWTHAWTTVPVQYVAFIIFYKNRPMRLRVSERTQAYALRAIWETWLKDNKTEEELLVTIRNAIIGRSENGTYVVQGKTET